MRGYAYSYGYRARVVPVWEILERAFALHDNLTSFSTATLSWVYILACSVVRRGFALIFFTDFFFAFGVDNYQFIV